MELRKMFVNWFKQDIITESKHSIQSFAKLLGWDNHQNLSHILGGKKDIPPSRIKILFSNVITKSEDQEKFLKNYMLVKNYDFLISSGINISMVDKVLDQEVIEFLKKYK